MNVSSLPRPIGYVLGGGGSLGAIQVGMLRALDECGVTPDVIAGTSVGALNGAVLALEPNGAVARLSDVWGRMKRQIVFPGGLLTQVRTLRRGKTHLFVNTGLAALIRDFVGPASTFADLTLPFVAVTLDVATARPHVIGEGPLLPALLASAAIPGIYPPVMYRSRRLYDGGLVANVPMRQAIALGARSLVVLDCRFPGQALSPPATLAEVVFYTALVTMSTQAVLEAPLVATEVPLVYLAGPAPRVMSPLDFDHTATLVASSYLAARSFLDGLDITGPGLYGSPAG